MDEFTDIRMSCLCTPPRFGMPWREKSSVLRETKLAINETKTDKLAMLEKLNRRYELMYS